MKNTKKGFILPLLIIIAVLVIGWGIYLYYQSNNSSQTTKVENQNVQNENSVSNISTNTNVKENIISDNWKTYTDFQKEFYLKYPLDGITVNEHYLRMAPTTGAGNLAGASFSLPSEYWKGTNLSSDSSISIEISPSVCSAGSFVSSSGIGKNDLTSTETVNGIKYTKIIHSEAAAGNIYKEIVYFTPQKSTHNPCSGIRLFLHSHNLGVLQESDPSVKAYNESKIIDFFSKIVSGVNFTVAPY